MKKDTFAMVAGGVVALMASQRKGDAMKKVLHAIVIMIRDAKEYREAGMEEKAVVLESLKGLVFGKVTMQENPENRK